MSAYFITGVTCSGKTSVGRLLKKKGFKVYDLDEVKSLVYWRSIRGHKKVQLTKSRESAWFEDHELVVDTKKLGTLVQTNDQVFITGVVSNPEAIAKYFDARFVLSLNKDTLMQRLSKRKGEKGVEEQSQTIKKLLAMLNKYIRDQKAKGYIEIDANGNTEDSVRQILNYIGATKLTN